MKIPDKLKFQYLLSLDKHLETKGVENRKETLKNIFEITKQIADLGFGEDDIHSITKDEDTYVKYEKWRNDKGL
jgi:threonyl-tRNA synthetase